MDSSTHYEILNVTSSASYEEIKASFHRLARQSHPDKQQQQQQQQQQAKQWQKKMDGDDAFKRIQQAWQVLRDDERRKQYDLELQQIHLTQKSKRDGAVSISLQEDCEEAYDEELERTVFVYDCRCGEELILVTEKEEKPQYLDCPGCCFVYKVII